MNRRDNYNRYIYSDAWRAKKFAVLRRDGYICQMCNAALAHQVHHLTYANFGDEPLEDLQAVCKPCHEEHHGIGERAGGR